ncbi:MAG: acetate--CoA ligase [Gammaproteobacteria bacterium CG22_combo_CG10-13_8_21_14_all_40_8]|nr:MAG: acetate--CoA ligase [Gammaproteobacteria bacterium CG22_combo_CG10-13_8_21_14_all_40_8]
MNPLNTYPVSTQWSENCHINQNKYQSLYQQSIENSDQFWAEQAELFLDWDQKWQSVQNNDFHHAQIQWFLGGKLNVCYNCVDRHLATRREQTAIIFEGDEPDSTLKITYGELHQKVCQLANALKQRGIKKGDRVCIYMPMIPEVAYAMLACARIGAVHSVVFGGFSPESLKNRILDADCSAVITADEGVRGGKRIPLKQNTDEALQHCPNVHSVFVVKRTGKIHHWDDTRDVHYHDAIAAADKDCPIEIMDAEDPLFILYTSGSTGTPKGVLHTSAGYLLYAAMTHKYVFDYQEGNIYWCTADAGWITGHSYIVYGPLANGATSLLFEGVPTYPDAGRFWEVVDKHQVNIFYTAPTALRALMAQGDRWVNKHSLKSLRLLGTVGEPINPEAWQWYYQVVGKSQLPIVDTWWQTETGGILISPLPGATTLKPGSATQPFFGVEPALIDLKGQEVVGAGEGQLVIKRSWPGQMRGVYADKERFFKTYFSQYAGYFYTGDGAKRDEQGDYWITGRIDDVLNVSGHRLGTAEIESALVLHPKVAEAAVVGFPHAIKGEGIYAYVTLNLGIEGNTELKMELNQLIIKEIGKIALPDEIQWAPSLPKTRSGKIMRRILRKISSDEYEQLGDISTLADPSVLADLIQNHQNQVKNR